MMLKKLIASILAMAMMAGLGTTVFADNSDEDNKSAISNGESINISAENSVGGMETYSVRFDQPTTDKKKAFEAFIQETDPLNTVYGMNGTNGEMLSESKREAFKAQLDDDKVYTKSAYAAKSPTDVWIGQYGNIYYGNNTGYSQLTSDAQGYLWAEGISDYIPNAIAGDYIETWGGTSIGWFGSVTPKKLRIAENVQCNKIGVSLSFPLGIGL